jgi:hypothetical protein
MRCSWSVSLFVWIFTAFQPVFSQKMVIHYMPPAEELELVKAYNLELLNLALERTRDRYGDFEIVTQSNSSLEQQSALKSLNERKEIHVVPTMTEANREKVFIPVRVPLYKGLFGIRLMMIHAEEKSRLDLATSELLLKKLTFIQGADWPDTHVLQANGFQVKTFGAKDQMIQALITRSGDVYPRGLVEIWDEIALEKGSPLAVQATVCLYYPAAIYFFLQRSVEGKRVAERLETGLLKAVDDGSFDAVFNKYWGDIIKKADLSGKKIIRLNNPNLPQSTPLANKKLWFIN